MTNLFGPGAFGCARPAASRPTFTPSNLPGDLPDWAQDCSSPLARDGTEWRAAWLNFLIANLRGVVSGSGLPASNLDDAIIARSIQSGGMNFGVATGSANNWTVALNLALASYRTGTVLWLKAPATNTSATVTVAIDGLAARPLKKADGTNPEIGDLVGGRFYPTIDDGTSIRVIGALASDINTQVAVNKSPFNISIQSLTTRTALSAASGFQSLASGAYVKKSATSNILVRASTNIFSTGGTGAGQMKVSVGGQDYTVITVNMTSGSNASSPNGAKIFAGLPAGSTPWALAFGRTDALAWASIVNPNSTDSTNLPPAGTNTQLEFSEFEP